MANRLDFFLGDFSFLRDAEKSLKAERILRNCLPVELGRHCSAGRLKEGRLQIYADNGATAMKLKLISSGVLEKLKTRGLPIDSLKISVAVNPEPKIEKRQKKTMGRKGMASFRELADTLEDSSLKSSVESLLEKLGHQDQALDDIE